MLSRKIGKDLESYRDLNGKPAFLYSANDQLAKDWNLHYPAQTSLDSMSIRKTTQPFLLLRWPHVD